MPINSRADLPAAKHYEEGIFVMTDERASSSGYPPAENRYFESDAHKNRNRDAAASPAHRKFPAAGESFSSVPRIMWPKTPRMSICARFYTTFDAIKDSKMDGLIITGGAGGAAAL